jgi:hypothetical protein
VKPLPVMTAPYESIVTAPKWVLTRLDGCPECGQYDNRPLLWASTDDGDGAVCTYRCNRCGHGWWTSWSGAREEVAA